MKPFELSAAEIASSVREGRLSAVEAMESCLSRLREMDPKVQAFLSVLDEPARAQAERVDDKRAKGKKLGRLAGVPVALKDNIAVEGTETTCASRILKGYRSPYDAGVVERLKAEDAVILGKTNLDEFAMGSSTENSALFKTKNPWDITRVPGGSSGGSAAAVAAMMCPLAFGSDTGGSIRQPAALCGVAGLKPTYGRVSRYGLVAFASSLDQIGPLARTVEDAALGLSVVAGHDPRDSTSADVAVPEPLSGGPDSLKGLRIGLPKEYFIKGIDPEIEAGVRAAVEVLEGLGASVREVSLPHTSYAVSTYYIIAPSEASSNLARYDGVRYGPGAPDGGSLLEAYEAARGAGFGAEVKRRIMLGTYALSSGYYDAYYAKAQRVRTLFKRDFEAVFAQVDLIAAPTSPTPAFRLGEKTGDPLSMYLTDAFTIPSSLAGNCSLSVPCGLTKAGLPIGLQLIGAPFQEERVLSAAAAFEVARPFPRLPA